VRDGFDDTEVPLARYYGEWLPDVLAELGQGHACKIVQPIEWRPASAGTRALGHLFRALWPGRPAWQRPALARFHARRLISRIEAGARPQLPVFRLGDLEEITSKHVSDFCRQIPAPRGSSRALHRRRDDRGPQLAGDHRRHRRLPAEGLLMTERKGFEQYRGDGGVPAGAAGRHTWRARALPRR